MKQMRNVRYKRMISTVTVLALLAGSIPGAAAEEAASPVYLCGLEEHVHTPECFERILICDREETEPVTTLRKVFVSNFYTHHHSDKCYTGDELTCGYEEDVYYHTHNEFCRDEEGNLVCGLKKSEPHEHTDECYETAETPEDEPGEAGHTHTRECYTQEKKLICEKPEEEGHTHTEACYTESKALTCGREEEEAHQHGDECYEILDTLTCGLEESEGHQHTEACHTISQTLTCGLEEKEAHHHDEECFRTTDTLICGLEENEEHQHTEACHRIEKELVCGREETDGHLHTDACYETTDVLSCGLEEKEGHHHTEACYTPEKKLTCKRAETDGHRHTDECYTVTREMTCGLEEKEGHTHGEACYEVTDVLVCTLPEKESTGSEGKSGETVKKLICDKPTSTHRHSEDCYRTDANGKKKLICRKLEVPVFVSSEENWKETETVTDPGHRHEEACWQLSEEPVCGKTEHVHTESCIAAEATLPAEDLPAEAAEEPAGEDPEDAEETTAEAPETDDNEPHEFEKELAGEDGTIYRITVKTGAHSGIPANAELSVRLIREGSDEYVSILDQAGETLREDRIVEELYAFDICLVNPDDPEEHYQPADEASVSVSISVSNMKLTEQEAEVQVLHFAEDRPGEPEVLHSEIVPEGNEPEAFSFETGSFSTFVLMKTTAAGGTLTIACDGVKGDQEYIALEADMDTIGKAGQETWYAAEDALTFTKRPEIQGTVNLVLRKGKTLTAPQGINLADGNKLVIRREEGADDSSAVLDAQITKNTVIDSAGIGSNGSNRKSGTLEIYGGTIKAKGADFAAGIGGGNGEFSGTITILGGIVTATGGHSAAGIGGGEAGSMYGTLSIRGGTVNATGGDNGAGIGGGQYFSDDIQYEKMVGGNGGNVVISAGKVTATGGIGASGIGGGESGSGGTLSINGPATVIAVSGDGDYKAGAPNKAEAIGHGDKTYRDSGSESTSGSIAFSASTKVYNAEGGDPVAQDDRVAACRGGWVKIKSTAEAEEYAISTKLNSSMAGTEETILVTDDKGTAIATAAAGTTFTIQVTCGVQVPKISCRVDAVYLEKDQEKSLELSGPTETEQGDVRTLTYTSKMPKADLTITATLTAAKKHITIDAYEKTFGTVTVSPENTAPDERPTVTFTCAKGYEDYWLKTLKVIGKSSQTVYAEIKDVGMPENIVNIDDDGFSWQFAMPDEDVILTGISFGRGTHYIAMNGECMPRKKVIEVTGENTVWNDSGAEDGWYVVRQDVTMKGTVHIRREVNLVLCDGAKLTAPKGIAVEAGKGGRLFIWAQEQGTGSLEAKGDEDCAGIGSTDDTGSGDITIYGGKITAKGDDDAAGIGGAKRKYVWGSITIGVPAGKPDSYTTVDARGGGNASGLGEGNGHSAGNIYIKGGTVNAWGGEDGAGIGGGQDCDLFSPIVISGGNVHAYGGKNGAGIGLGPRYGDHGGNVKDRIEISGANTYVYAEGGSEDGAGIGSGEDGNMQGSIIIRDATVDVVAHDGAAGIGGGQDGYTNKGSITIENARLTVKVTEGEGAGIGSGEDADSGETTINGGVIEIFTKSGASIGGADDQEDGKLNLYTHALVSSGSAGNYVAAGDRIATCRTGDIQYVKIESCTHPGGSITPVDHTNHNITCQWCGFNNEPEAHIFGTDRSREDFYKCSCGYSRKRLVTGKADREGYGNVLAGLSADAMTSAKLEVVPGDTVYVHLEPEGGAKITGISASYYAEGDQEPRAFTEFTAFPADHGKNYQFVMPDPDDDRPEMTLVMQTSGGGEKAPIPDLTERGVTYLTIISVASEEYLIAGSEEEAKEKADDPANWKSSDAGALAFEGLDPGKMYLIYGRTKATQESAAGVQSDPLRTMTMQKLESLVIFPETNLSVGNAVAVMAFPVLAGNLSYQWYRDDQPISGQTKSVYTLMQEDVDHTLKVTAVQVTDKKGTKVSAERSLEFKPEGSVTLVFQAADGSWGNATKVRTNETVRGSYSIDEAYLKNSIPSGEAGDGYIPVSYSFGYLDGEDRRTPIPKNRTILITEDQSELHIYFERNSFTLKFYPNMEGKGTPETFRVLYGASLKEFSGMTAAQSGYTFAGWSVNAKPAGTEYIYVKEPISGKEYPNFRLFALDSETMPAKDLNLYPVMIRPRIEVHLDLRAVDANKTTYNMNGWRNPVSYTDDTTKAYLNAAQKRNFLVPWGETLPTTAMKNLATVTRDGYKLDGWYSANGVRWNEIFRALPLFCDSMIPEKREGISYPYYTLTLKANWKLRKATLHYDLGEGSWDGTDQENVSPGAKVTISETPVTPPGGTVFLGWKDQKGHYHAGGSSLLYEDLSLVDEIGKGASPNVITLTAQYFEFPHIVAFDTRGGSPVDPVHTESESLTVDLTGKETKRTGMTFKGWALSPDSQQKVNTVSFEDGKSVIWVYAIWEASQYSVYFSGNGGTMDGKSLLRKQYTYDEAITDIPAATRDHYEFAGWNPALPSWMPARTIVTFATWEPANHTWTFDTAGGSEVKPITAQYGSPVQAPVEPTRDGYLFTGWMSEGKYVALPEHMDGNRTYLAGWKQLGKVPEKPVVTYVSTTIIEVEARPGEEYAIVYEENGKLPGEEDWRTPDKYGRVVFYFRMPNTRYHIYARFMETGELLPSGMSEPAEVKTKRLYPDVPETTAGFNVILVAVPDDADEHIYQYSVDKGRTWSMGQVIENLQPDTTYEVSARWGEPRLIEAYPQSKSAETTTDLPINSISIKGTLRIGNVLRASYAPQEAERVTWQWYREGNKAGEWTLIEKADAASYTITSADAGKKLRAVATHASRLPDLEEPIRLGTETAPVTKPGTVSSEIVCGTNVPGIELTGMTEKLILAIAGEKAETRRMRGENILLTVRVNDIGGSISAKDQKLIDNALKAAALSARALQYFDISVNLKIGNDEPVQLTDLRENRISMVLTVPKNDVVSGNITRTYYIARLHDGEAGIIAKGSNTVFSFASSLFSPYALGYSDTKKSTPSGGGSGTKTKTEINTRHYLADFRFTLYERQYSEAVQDRMKGYEELVNGLELKADILLNAGTKARDISARLMPVGKPDKAVPIRVFGNNTDVCAESKLLGTQPYYFGDARKLMAYASRFTKLTGLPAVSLGLLNPEVTKQAAGEVVKAWKKEVTQLQDQTTISLEQIERIVDSWKQLLENDQLFRQWLEGITALLPAENQAAAEEALQLLPGILAEAAGGESLTITESDGTYLCANAKNEVVFRYWKDGTGTFFELFTPKTAETGRPYLLYEKKNSSVRITAEWIREGQTLLDLKLEISGIPTAFPGATRMNATLHSGGRILPAADMTAQLTMDARGKMELSVSSADQAGTMKPLFRAYGNITLQDTGEQKEMPIYDSATLKQYTALLNEEGDSIGDLLDFVTPELDDAVQSLLKTVSEHGYTILTEDLNKHGIP